MTFSMNVLHMTMKVLFSRQSLSTNITLMKYPYTLAIEHRINLFSELLIFHKTPNMNGYIPKCPNTPQHPIKRPQHPQNAPHITSPTPPKQPKHSQHPLKCPIHTSKRYNTPKMPPTTTFQTHRTPIKVPQNPQNATKTT